MNLDARDSEALVAHHPDGGPVENGSAPGSPPATAAGPGGRWWRRWPAIVAWSLLLTAVALGVSLALPARYAATASLLFADRGVGDQVIDTGTDSVPVDASRQAATNVELVSLGTIASAAARRLQDGSTRADVADAVDVLGQGQSNVVTVTAHAPTAGGAARLANVYAQAAIAYQQAQVRAGVQDARERIKAVLRTTTRRKGAAQALRSRLRQLNSLLLLRSADVSLAEPAVAPTAPDSPKPARNAIIALVLGLATGIGAAVARERNPSA